MSQVQFQPKKAWCFLVYMAGDNDLDQFGRLDLSEMDQLPSDEHLHVVVQFDSREAATYRFRFFPGGHEQTGEPLGETNAGDPSTLTDFVAWARQHFPAERTVLVIWNHGTGIRDLPPDFDYASVREDDEEAVEAELRRALFRTTLLRIAREQHLMRGVAIDATNRDYLDTQELARALAAVPWPDGGLDLLGFDACLMATVEIAYQLRGLTSVIVGSQEREPGQGWPYHRILRALAAQPEMTAQQLGQAIVKGYGDSTRGEPQSWGLSFTQSALDMSQMQRTYDLTRALAQMLLQPGVRTHSVVEYALPATRTEVVRFHDRGRHEPGDVADMLDWCQLLDLETKDFAGAPFREALLALQEHLRIGSGLVLANDAHGTDESSRVHGVSIYWPMEPYLPVYDTLDFAETGWGQLAKAMLAL
jgi:hypothetical protein